MRLLRNGTAARMPMVTCRPDGPPPPGDPTRPERLLHARHPRSPVILLPCRGPRRGRPPMTRTTKITLGAGLFALLASLVVAVTATSGGAQAEAQTGAQTGAQTPTRHFVANLKGATAPFSLGYTLADNSSVSSLSTLPTGVQSVFWLGQKCPTPADSTFKAKVDALASNAKVFAYYLSDEPHIGDCPGGPAALRSRADYIRAASGGRQKSFIVLSKVADYKPFAPASSHVDLVGLDPYPCSIANPQCDLSKIGEKVAAAR